LTGGCEFYKDGLWATIIGCLCVVMLVYKDKRDEKEVEKLGRRERDE